jgi:hypothetical protein
VQTYAIISKGSGSMNQVCKTSAVWHEHLVFSAFIPFLRANLPTFDAGRSSLAVRLFLI